MSSRELKQGVKPAKVNELGRLEKQMRHLEAKRRL